MTHETETPTAPRLALRYRLAKKIDDFAAQFERSYLCLTTLTAFIGYLVIILFPFLAYKSIDIIFRAMQAPTTSNTWFMVAGFTALAAVCALVSLRIFQTAFVKTKGVSLDKDITPELFNTLEEVRKHYKAAAFKEVILTDQYELRTQELPTFGYPIWPQRILIIGLPFLQTTAPKHFKAELSRLIGRHSRRGRKTTDWLYRTCCLWQEYHAALSQQHRFGELPLRWFFKAYAPLMLLLSRPAARLNELAADSAAMDYVNDVDLFDAIKHRLINDIYMRTQFWPKIRKMALRNPHDPLSPTSKLEELSQAALTEIDTRRWLQVIYNTKHAPEDDMPDLRLRMHNIGHSRIRPVIAIRASAAGIYLRDAKQHIIPEIDRLWRVTTLPNWVKEHKARRREVRRIRRLSKKSHYGILSLKEMWQYAQLAKTLKKDPILKSFRKLVKRNAKNRAIFSNPPADLQPPRQIETPEPQLAEKLVAENKLSNIF